MGIEWVEGDHGYERACWRGQVVGPIEPQYANIF